MTTFHMITTTPALSPQTIQALGDELDEWLDDHPDVEASSGRVIRITINDDALAVLFALKFNAIIQTPQQMALEARAREASDTLVKMPEPYPDHWVFRCGGYTDRLSDCFVGSDIRKLDDLLIGVLQSGGGGDLQIEPKGQSGLGRGFPWP